MRFKIKPFLGVKKKKQSQCQTWVVISRPSSERWLLPTAQVIAPKSPIPENSGKWQNSWTAQSDLKSWVELIHWEMTGSGKTPALLMRRLSGSGLAATACANLESKIVWVENKYDSNIDKDCINPQKRADEIVKDFFESKRYESNIVKD